MDLAQAVPSFGAFWRRKRALAAAVMATKGCVLMLLRRATLVEW